MLRKDLINSELKERINELLGEHSRFKSTDALNSVNNPGVFENCENLSDSQCDYLFNHSKKMFETIGVNPVCISFGTITCDLLQLNCTPVFFKETKADYKNKRFEAIGALFLNPIVESKLKLSPDQEVIDLDSFEKKINIPHANYSIDRNSFIGLFHPFRYNLIRELSELRESTFYSENIAAILNLEHEELKTVHVEYDSSFLFETNSTQEDAIERIKTESIVLHGPPGTGKTQFIASLMARAIKGRNNIIFTSQKKSAIEACYMHLQSVQLNHFTLVAHEGKDKDKRVIEDLKKTWDFITQNEFNIENNKGVNSYEIEWEFFSRLFDLHEKRILKSFYTIYNQGIQKGFIPVKHHSISVEHLHRLVELNNLLKASEIAKILTINIDNLKGLQDSLPHPKDIQAQFDALKQDFPINSKSELDKLVVFFVKLRYFDSTIFKKYEHIIASKKSKFIRLYKKWLGFQIDLKELKKLISHWRKKPTSNDLNAFLALVEKGDLRSKILLKIKLKKFLSQSPVNLKSDIKNYKKVLEIEHKTELTKKEFYNIDVFHFDELHLIKEIIDKIEDDDYAYFKRFSENQKNKLFLIQPSIQKLNRFLNHCMNKDGQSDILEAISNYRFYFNASNKLKTLLNGLDNGCLKLIKDADSLEHAIFTLVSSHFTEIFKNTIVPSTSNCKEMIQMAIDNIEQDEKKKAAETSLIHHSIQNNFNSFNELTSKPNRFLSQTEIELKAKLKAGKKILIHEFSKKKRFKTLRNLMESDAALWIKLMKPIAMMNPLQLSTFAPMDNGLFNLGIIDEASQMPLSHALGTIQRCQRIVIAGDENQIEPLSFFQSNSEFDPSVLHQAKYHFKNIELNFHYRSQNKELVEFSNAHFYHNKLKVLEHASQFGKKAVYDHFTEAGHYHNHCNEIEAKRLIQHFIKHYTAHKKNVNLTYSIIAFSQSQLQAITREFSTQNAELMNRLLMRRKLLIKSLDQVQGEEADFVFISLGYARNLQGKFELRFGPINLAGGEKRLNVLFTRAIREIHFFSSVRLNNFGKSTNKGVKTLKNWFAYMETKDQDSKDPKNTKTAKLHLFDLFEQCNSGKDVLHLIKMYHKRGWTVDPD